MGVIYYLFINLCAFVLMGWDKRKSVKHYWRIPEKKLLLLPVLGGGVGVLIGMYIWKHKTKKPLFYIGVPMLYLLHRFLIVPVISDLLFYAKEWW